MPDNTDTPTTKDDANPLLRTKLLHVILGEAKAITITTWGFMTRLTQLAFASWRLYRTKPRQPDANESVIKLRAELIPTDTPSRIRVLAGLGLLALFVVKSFSLATSTGRPDRSLATHASGQTSPHLPDGILTIITNLERTANEISQGVKSQSDTIIKDIADSAEKERKDQKEDELKQTKDDEAQAQQQIVNDIARQRSINGSRLKSVTDHYVSKEPTKSNFPQRPGTPPSIRLFRKPTTTLETSFDRIYSINVSPNDRLLQIRDGIGWRGIDGRKIIHNNHLIAFKDFSDTTCDSAFLAKPDALSYYKDASKVLRTEYEIANRYGTFAPAFRKTITTGTTIMSDAVFCDEGRLITAVDFSWQGHGERKEFDEQPLSFWSYTGGPLKLIDVYPITGIVFSHNSYKEKILLLLNWTYNGGQPLQVWSKHGMIGAAKVDYKIGTEKLEALQMDVHPKVGHVALLYRTGVRIYDHSAITEPVSNVRPLATIDAPFEISENADTRDSDENIEADTGYVRFSPGGNTLVIAFVEVSTKMANHLGGRVLLLFVDTRTWTVKSSTTIGSHHRGTFSPDGALYMVSCEIRSLIDHHKATVFSVETGKPVSEVAAVEMTTAFFIDNNLIVTGGRSVTDSFGYVVYENAPGDNKFRNPSRVVKENDISIRNVNIWEARTGTLWG